MIGVLNDVITYSQAYPFDVDTTMLYLSWRVAKDKFIDQFGGKYIVRSEHPVRIEVTQEQKDRKFKEFLTKLDDNSVLTEEFENFLKDNESGFFYNIVVSPNEQYNIHEGTKLCKTFKSFVPRENVRLAQDIASTYIQEGKTEGYLYLSVHPLDYLTVSENNANWRSCHGLDGKFRSGNLSYMTDTTTVVAYIANEKQEQLKCFPDGVLWNSKKWRMLLHIKQGELVWFNKQYPFNSIELETMVAKMVEEYCGNGQCLSPINSYGSRWVSPDGRPAYALRRNYIFIDDCILDARDIFDYDDYFGYADLVNNNSCSIRMSWFYDPKKGIESLPEYGGGWVDDLEWKEMMHTKIGGKAYCPACGKAHVSRFESFLCENCTEEYDAEDDFFVKCVDCQHRIYDDNEFYEEDGEILCASCFRERAEEDKLTLELK